MEISSLTDINTGKEVVFLAHIVNTGKTTLTLCVSVAVALSRLTRSTISAVVYMSYFPRAVFLR
jgi:acyl-CoA hydrolase